MLLAVVSLLMLQGPPEDAADVDAGISGSTVVHSTREQASAGEFVVSSQVLKAAPRVSTVDLLRLVPGLVASQHSGEGKAHQLFLRGFDAVHGQDVELNVAGLPVNEVSHIHALGYADLNWVIPEVVGSMQVFEGASRAFQGDFANAGTVRMNLGLAEQGLLAKGTLGLFGQMRVLLAARPFDDETSFAAVDLYRTDGFGAQRAASRASFISQWAHSFDGVKVRAVATAYGTLFDSPGVLRDDDLKAGRVEFFDAAAPRQGGAVSRFQGLVSAEKTMGDTTLLAEAFALRIDTRLRNNFTGTLVNPLGDGLEQTHGVTTVGARVQYDRGFTLLNAPLTLSASLQGRRDDAAQAQRRYRDSDGVGYGNMIDANFTQTAITAWLEAQWRPAAWFFLVGARADALAFETFDRILKGKTDFDGSTGTARSAFGVHPGLKAGLGRSFGPHFQLHANYGDGFRSPQARSLAQGEKAPFVNTHGGDLGATFSSAKFTAQLVGFMSWIQDDVFFDHVSGTTISAGASLRTGGTLALTAKPWSTLLIAGNITYANAQLASGAQLPYFAPLVGRVDASYSNDFALGGQRFDWKVGAAFTGIGPRPLRFGDLSNPVALVDATARISWKLLAVSLDVTNLLDSRWRDGEFTFASNVPTQAQPTQLPARQFTAGAPRQFLVSLQVNP